MGTAALTSEQRVAQTTQTLQTLLTLTLECDLAHLREVLPLLERCDALQDCHCAQFVTLFERLNALICEHKAQLSDDDTRRWTRFAAQGKSIAPALGRHLVAVEDWGRNLPALAHFMILTLFADDEHTDVQRDLLVAHTKRGYQTFFLCCDMERKDAARYNYLVDACEAASGPQPALLRLSHNKTRTVAIES